jgi:multiple sugar transport system permease protein
VTAIPLTLAARAPRFRGTWTVASVAILTVLAFFVLLPFLWMISASFRPEGDIIANPTSLIPTAVTFEHFIDIWTRIPFGDQLINTVIFAGTVTLVSLLFDSMAAYALARFEFPGRTIIFIAIIATMMLPFQVTLIPVFKLLAGLDWINTYQGLIVPRTTSAFGIFFLRQYLLSIPKELEDAARIDGASEFRIWWQVIMPLAMPALLTIGLFHLLANWNDLLWPLIFATDASMQTVSAGLALFKGQHVTEYGLLMAGSLIALTPMVIAFIAIQRRFVESIATTGLK